MLKSDNIFTKIAYSRIRQLKEIQIKAYAPLGSWLQVMLSKVRLERHINLAEMTPVIIRSP